jgi:F0F1-type ATP synthase alpha subunit
MAIFITAPALWAGFLDYGLLGLFCAIFAAVIAFMAKQFLKLHKENEQRIKELEKDLLKYLSEDRSAIIEALKDSSQVLKDCKEALQNSNRVTEKLIKYIDAKN